MLEFQEFWKIYKSNIPLIDQLGFEHWWSLNWLERAKFENNKIYQGMILYNVQDNLIFSAKVAFSINYIQASIFGNIDFEIPKVYYFNIFRVMDLKVYLKNEYSYFLEALEKIKIKYIYDKNKRRICFYMEER